MAMFVFCSFSINAENADKDKQFEHGNKTHDQHCNKCHTDKVYTRDNRFVKSMDALSKQVVRCKNNTGAPWFDEDTEAVVHFLNEKYYKF
jgi:mono/diheme cytochrome c family protein